MNKLTLILLVLLAGGCESLRFAATDAQKQNAYLHWRTAGTVSDMTRDEGSSATLCDLSDLSARQSLAFVHDYGLPHELPQSDSPAAILNSTAITDRAIADAQQRPDVFDVSENVFELAIGIAALFGGVYGTRAAGYLKQARAKSRALEEIVRGNELFKKQNTEKADGFKQAHSTQSQTTRQLVAEMKGL